MAVPPGHAERSEESHPRFFVVPQRRIPQDDITRVLTCSLPRYFRSARGASGRMGRDSPAGDQGRSHQTGGRYCLPFQRTPAPKMLASIESTITPA